MSITTTTDELMKVAAGLGYRIYRVAPEDFYSPIGIAVAILDGATPNVSMYLENDYIKDESEEGGYRIEKRRKFSITPVSPDRGYSPADIPTVIEGYQRAQALIDHLATLDLEALTSYRA